MAESFVADDGSVSPLVAAWIFPSASVARRVPPVTELRAAPAQLADDVETVRGMAREMVMGVYKKERLLFILDTETTINLNAATAAARAAEAT
jgi:hypothetical protein